MNGIGGHAVAIFTIILWGITFISTKILLLNFSAFEILFSRFFIGWLTLLFLYPHKMAIIDAKSRLTFAGAGLSGVTLYFLLENISLEYTTASNVAIIVSLAPFFTALLAALLVRTEKLEINFFIGFGVAFTGIVLVTAHDFSFEINPFGDILALLAAMAWAFYSIFTRKITAMGFNNLGATRVIFFYGLLFMLPLFLWRPYNVAALANLDLVNALNLLFLGIGASAICFATWNYAIKRLGVIKSSLYIYLVPVITIIAAHFILKERLSATMITGAGLTIAGLLIGERGFKPTWAGLRKIYKKCGFRSRLR